MAQIIHHVDAFTDRAFAGNPAAVCVLAGPAPAPWMQAVAREMNLSETAFLHPESDGWRLRWFTPALEVDLCGHATLASAHVLWTTQALAAGAEARFLTRSGVLTAAQRGDWIELDFPSLPVAPMRSFDGIDAALGAEIVHAGRSRDDVLVEVASEPIVRGLTPDFALLRRVDARGVIVTARADGGEFDFVSRFFAPAVGVDEDPVTGSAHCALAPYWSVKLGKRDLVAYQASARGGVLRLRAAGERVRIAGRAVTVLHGELLAGPGSAEVT
jgi:predicted PhzF superfamily epimerase YddE/YHI9